MFAVLYRFEVKENHDKQFIEAWKNLTSLIYKHEGSLGSRLHKQDKGVYIAYAQWPQREDWLNAGNKLPQEASAFRDKMREACVEVKTIYELTCVEDLLKAAVKQ